MAGKHPDDSHSAPGTSSVSDVRLLAAQLFNETWRLLGLPDRSQDDISRMIGAAHASRFHWSQVPGHTPAHLARGDWLISRVYAELRRAEPALYHARLVLGTCQENGIGDWDLAFAYEALARAHAVAGERGRARVHRPGPGRGQGHRPEPGPRAAARRPGDDPRPAPLLVGRSGSPP
jgi:hypothetical protein